ncbi:MAG: regulatory protein RecX [Pseudomonadota bacterium]
MPRSVAKALPPYDVATLERAALDYAARYATTRAKLAAYLRRKLRERGWDGDDAPPVAALVERFAERGYVDDRAFAAARTDALLRRGYGARRIGTALRAAGIDAETTAGLRARMADEAEAAALRYARRKRIGPFADHAADPAEKRRWIASMARAGHAIELVLRLLDADPDELMVEP